MPTLYPSVSFLPLRAAAASWLLLSLLLVIMNPSCAQNTSTTVEDVTTTTNESMTELGMTTNESMTELGITIMTSNNATNNESMPTMAPSMAPTYLGGISPECANGTTMLEQDEALTAALNALLAGYREEFQKECPFTLTNTACNVVFGKGAANQTYQNMCVEKGGQIYEQPIVLQCGIVPLNVDYDLGVVPECIASDCNVSAPGFDIGALVANENITNFASSLDNGGCEGKVETSSASSSSWWSLVVVLPVGVLVGSSGALVMSIMIS